MRKKQKDEEIEILNTEIGMIQRNRHMTPEEKQLKIKQIEKLINEK